MTGTPTPPLIGIIDRPGQFMILIGMNNGISSVYVETILKIVENQGEDRSASDRRWKYCR